MIDPSLLSVTNRDVRLLSPPGSVPDDFGRRSLLLTAVCVSIDRFPQNTAPICCLSFDGIGARHPGMTHDAGAKSPRAAHSHSRATRKN